MRSFSLMALALAGLVACDGAEPVEPAPPEAPEAPPAPEAPAAPEVKESIKAPSVNLNTASEAAFKEGVPGLGDKMAHEFEEYRPYVSIAQFRKEMSKYVDEAKITEYEQYVFVPIDPNTSDAATLAQLPGLSAEEAEAVIAKRPFADAAAFKAALGEALSEDELAAVDGLLQP